MAILKFKYYEKLKRINKMKLDVLNDSISQKSSLEKKEEAIKLYTVIEMTRQQLAKNADIDKVFEEISKKRFKKQIDEMNKEIKN